MSDATKRIFALETIDAGTFVVPAGEYGDFAVTEADRLIANGAAVDPDERIVTAPAHDAASGDLAAVIAERDAFHVKCGELQAALDVAQAEVAQCKSALEASHSEIDRLTKALAAAEKKK